MTSSPVYIIMCDRWGGSSYSTEAIDAVYYKDKAYKLAEEYQGNTSKADVFYYVTHLEIIE